MRNAFFSEEELSVLLSWERLRLVASTGADVAPTIPAANYLDWINKNSHKNLCREVVVALSGTTCFSLGGVTYPCRPGTVFLIDADEEHDFYYPPFNDDFRHLWFTLVSNAVLLATPFEKRDGKVARDRNFSYAFAEDNPAVRLFVAAWDALPGVPAADHEFRRLCLKHSFMGLALELCRVGYGGRPKVCGAGDVSHQRAVINAIVRHMEATGGKGLDIEKLAYLSGYSKFHFARMFKEMTGVTAHKLINSMRIERCRALAAKGLNKKQISDELGFSCPAAFSRWHRDNMLAAEEG